MPNDKTGSGMVLHQRDGVPIIEQVDGAPFPTGVDPYTHVLYKTHSGGGGMIQCDRQEVEAALRELHDALMENRPSYVVLHPTDEAYDGSEYVFIGTICELRRITTSGAQELIRGANEEQAKREEEEKAMRNMGMGSALITPGTRRR